MPKKKNKNLPDIEVLEKNQNTSARVVDDGFSYEVTAGEMKVMAEQGLLVDIPDESPVWSVMFHGFPEMNVLYVKFTLLTTGEPSTGQIVMEIECRPGVNRILNDWVKNPSYKETIVEVSSVNGDILDIIKMKCRPVAMAVGDLGDSEMLGKPWCTTIQLSSQEIEYIEFK